MDSQFIEEIRNYLIQEYKCHSIILYGSYVNGDYTEESDIDIVCFTDEENMKSNDTSIVGNKQLDAWIYKTEKMEDIEGFLRIRGGKVLLDKKGLCKGFLHKINELFQQGPKQLTLEEKHFLQSWIQKMHRRAQKGDVEGNYRYHWLLVDSLSIYFSLKDIWYLGPKQSLKWLYENEREVYVLFDRVLGPNAETENINQLVEHIMNI
ncbi:DNA polymerase III subunit beta [Bacillus pseudomycoides]|uniref:DNA polymerase III subunit beta n=1 Tax=Bacillus pseudomycoides TaxID=64104 RepID=A0AA91ZTB6_9BACI|nr:MULTISPECIES: nucleotidyltransferase domain-containing protein [Bacillus]PEB51450.1 DNA polymerase III subunit beta [Bacillus sp. AFS098217]PED82586.1 DNA polymerase III subunit beta [Bacillus pseudomycoides]PEU12124.1 DNA polymerase III subunit beta [Bacillus sp. AFS014408]PEU17692.1 DNA polymerase III subunit beta [Bacillus sp. AFS019443]PFW60932.1 DNA polymerase III subunit beta [Bacillus sp. AFS075034]